MQFELTVDLATTKEWGLNMQQGVVFAYLYNCPCWCTQAEDDPRFFNISNGKLVDELSALTDKRDTMLRYILQLVKAGVIERRSIDRKQYVRLTDKGKTWKRKRSEQRDKNPVEPEQRDKNPARRDKNPAAAGNISDVSVLPTSEQPDQEQSALAPKPVRRPTDITPGIRRATPEDVDTILDLFEKHLPKLTCPSRNRLKSAAASYPMRSHALFDRWCEENDMRENPAAFFRWFFRGLSALPEYRGEARSGWRPKFEWMFESKPFGELVDEVEALAKRSAT